MLRRLVLPGRGETMSGEPAYMDASHPSNVIRPQIRCWGCGNLGCVGKHWGNWCFECNKARIGRISSQLERAASPSTAKESE
jgi:hypothetical protein